MGSRPAFSTEGVSYQQGLITETLSQRKKKDNKILEVLKRKKGKRGEKKKTTSWQPRILFPPNNIFPKLKGG